MPASKANRTENPSPGKIRIRVSRTPNHCYIHNKPQGTNCGSTSIPLIQTQAISRSISEDFCGCRRLRYVTPGLCEDSSAIQLNEAPGGGASNSYQERHSFSSPTKACSTRFLVLIEQCRLPNIPGDRFRPRGQLDLIDLVQPISAVEVARHVGKIPSVELGIELAR